MPRFCVNCGTPLTETARFCANCGAAVVTPTQSSVAETPPSVVTPPESSVADPHPIVVTPPESSIATPSFRNSGWGRWKKIFVAGAVAALVAIIVVAAINLGTDKTASQQSSSQPSRATRAESASTNNVFPDPGPQANLGFFDIQGIHLGMNRTQVEEALGKNHQRWQVLKLEITTHMPLRERPDISSYPPISVNFDETGKVSCVQSDDTNYPFDWPRSIVKEELTHKYGPPNLKFAQDKWVYAHNSSIPCDAPPKWCPLREILSAEQKAGGSYMEMGIEEWAFRADGKPGFIMGW